MRHKPSFKLGFLLSTVDCLLLVLLESTVILGVKWGQKKVELMSRQRKSYGSGLSLRVNPRGEEHWFFRRQKDKRRYDIPLGPRKLVNKTEALEKARLIYGQIDAGLDPIAERRRNAEIPTFASAAATVHKLQTSSAAEKTRKQWWSMVERYALAKLGTTRLDRVTEKDIGLILAPLERDKPDTAIKLKGYLLAILDWGHGQDYRDQPTNRDKLKAVINKPSKRGAEKRHRPSLDYRKLPEFWSELITKSGAGALALQFAILTAARPGEVRGAKWDEIDLQHRKWTIPAERMKAGKMHVVPLSDGAMEILRETQSRRLPNRRHVFLTGTVDKPMSDMTMSKVLKTMGLKGEATSHGFRSSFRNWSSATFPAEREAAEFSLAHGVRNEVEGAYLTDTLFERRQTLLQAWSSYCLSQATRPDSGDNVLEMKRA